MKLFPDFINYTYLSSFSNCSKLLLMSPLGEQKFLQEDQNLRITIPISDGSPFAELSILLLQSQVILKPLFTSCTKMTTNISYPFLQKLVF